MAVAPSSLVQRTRNAQLQHTRRTVRSLDQALARMRAGERLRLQFSEGRPLWSLSGGSSVVAETASLLVNNSNIAPAEAGLFPGLPGQSWEFRA